MVVMRSSLPCLLALQTIEGLARDAVAPNDLPALAGALGLLRHREDLFVGESRLPHAVLDAASAAVGLSPYECTFRRGYAPVLEAWRQDYSGHGRHTALGLHPPAVYRRASIFEPRSVLTLNLR